MIRACLFSFWLCVGLLHADALRVATYNVQNYLVTDRMVDGRWRSAYPKPEAERQALYEVILAVRPDILALQEMGPGNFLAALQRDLAAMGLEYPFAYLGDGEDEERHTAVLSRVEAEQVVRHRGLDFPYLGERVEPRRGLLEVRFAEFSLYVVHLKSRFTNDKRDPESTERRMKEAQAIRDRIREVHGEGDAATAYLVAGDFNALIHTSPLRRFLEVGERALARPLDVADSRGEVWTYFWEKAGSYTRIDFLLASPPIFQRWEASGRRGGIFDGPTARTASDHRLVWVEWE